ncbi:MAG: hypothetical protein N2053_06775 [Chitinispirillaceae bacterium]|nr:hypothetical protein [Chitinispirillaceae bacterium]
MYHKFVLCCIAAVIISSTTFANDVNNGGHVGIVRTLSAHTNGKTGLHAGGTFKGATEWDYVKGIEDRTNPILLSGDVYLSYGLFKFLDISIDIPAYFDITGWEQNRGGAGDLELAIKLTNPFQKEDAVISHAYYLKVMFPTGQDDRGYFPRHIYFSDENNEGISPFTSGLFLFNPQLIWTFDFSPLSVPLAFHINGGGVVANTINDSKKRGIITAGMGLE